MNLPALTPFFSAIAQIDAGQFALTSVMALADQLRNEQQQEHAILLYKYWLLANPQEPMRFVAEYNCGVQLQAQGQLLDAQRFFQQAIASKPNFHQARQSLALCQERTGDKAGALATLQQLLDELKSVTPDNLSNKVQALKNIARLERNTATAETVLKEAAELDPMQTELLQHWINTRQTRCVWPVIQPLGPYGVEQVKEQLAPLSASIYSDDPQYLLRSGARYTRQQMGHNAPLTLGAWPLPAKPQRDRLKIGYLSSDLCNHAIGYLMTDVFKHHRKDRYEIVVYNIGERTNDGLQTKVMASVERWVDIRSVPDKQAARQIVEDGIDILLDINGHTNYQRTKLLAMKPAPILANWLGYPGSMGSEVHDYIIADDFIIPPTHESYYSERVLRLPCYQPNGALMPIPQPRKTREELGLPASGFVFCCFNGAIKITAPVFARWMTILKAVPDSVLWLRGGGSDDAHVHLRQEAERQGVSAQRLIVLPFQSNTEYLACHRYADLFLDTFPYGAHTTASDALRAGVPIVTLAGEGFPSRVCGSLSRAAGIPEMVCRTPGEYIEKAIHLAQNPAAFKALRDKLQQCLPTCSLFDSAKLVTHLEDLFEQMWTAYCAGQLQQEKDFRKLYQPS
ncbi:hypothetical protein MASR1M60_21570 [Rhodocyclaceae bacterium]